MNRFNLVNWGAPLTGAQVDRIEKAASSISLHTGKVSKHNIEPGEELRVTDVGFFHPKEHEEVFQLAEMLVYEANKNYYGFNIEGIAEIQYGVYTEGSHYDWHVDIDWDGDSTFDRKITIIIMLSDPSDYEGGEVHFEGDHTISSPDRGTIVSFPSYTPHKVDKVTKGVRKTMVIWAEGPRFV